MTAGLVVAMDLALAALNVVLVVVNLQFHHTINEIAAVANGGAAGWCAAFALSAWWKR